MNDPTFVGGEHRVRYRIDVAGAAAPFRIDAELWYQPIGFRWAQNLRLQPAPETDRFVAYYESMAGSSGIVQARDSVTLPGPSRREYVLAGSVLTLAVGRSLTSASILSAVAGCHG
jgi:hypothetical protein